MDKFFAYDRLLKQEENLEHQDTTVQAGDHLEYPENSQPSELGLPGTVEVRRSPTSSEAEVDELIDDSPEGTPSGPGLSNVMTHYHISVSGIAAPASSSASATLSFPRVTDPYAQHTTQPAVASASSGFPGMPENEDGAPRDEEPRAAHLNPPPLPLGDPVVRFLEEVGLSADMAGTLREVGITDERRMRALGALHHSALEGLLRQLRTMHVDYTARLLIREGLKRRAAQLGG